MIPLMIPLFNYSNYRIPFISLISLTLADDSSLMGQFSNGSGDDFPARGEKTNLGRYP